MYGRHGCRSLPGGSERGRECGCSRAIERHLQPTKPKKTCQTQTSQISRPTFLQPQGSLHGLSECKKIRWVQFSCLAGNMPTRFDDTMPSPPTLKISHRMFMFLLPALSQNHPYQLKQQYHLRCERSSGHSGQCQAPQVRRNCQPPPRRWHRAFRSGP